MKHFDAVILAGGSGRRLGGVDKAGVLVAGLPLLDRVLLASAEARHTVVVGDPRPTVRAVRWTRENPAGGGPLAGLAAGLDALGRLNLADPSGGTGTAPDRENPGDQDGVVVVLATDLPHLRPADLERLLTRLAAEPLADGAVFRDATGRSQPLAAAYRIAPIRAALGRVDALPGKAVKLVVDQLAVVSVPDQGFAVDCDTPEQLAAARAYFEGQG